ncbi:ABC transporter permease [Planctobacterium marinum]|uniref:ABC transporter permease n=1 Tax=Planctobacterium marinum TaxID=1631968 RepID=UPI001E5AF94E|nr:ABC transporter permease [Planctobacterium marinum]MCC2607747.1 ABC transporter permease [Planctobacterium marinum]
MKSSSFLAVVVTTLGFSLSALLCVLTLAYLILVEPLPYPDQEKLYRVDHHLTNHEGKSEINAFTYPGLVDFYKNQTEFSLGAMVTYGKDVLTSLPEQPTLNTGYVTPEWFQLLGTSLALGRGFTEEEGLESFIPQAVLTHKTWMDVYGGDSEILDKTVSFSGVNFKVIGVLPETFVEPEIYEVGRQVDIWLPWDYNLSSGMHFLWGNINPMLMYVGRLAESDQGVKAIERSVSMYINDTWQEKNAHVEYYNGWSIDARLTPLADVVTGDVGSIIYLLIIGAVGLLIIACANITNVFISRTANNGQNLAISASLGAKPRDIFRQYFIEYGIIIGFSITFALLLSYFGFVLIQNHLADILPRAGELQINFTTIVCALLLAVLLTSIFALFSVKMINYGALKTMLQSSGKGRGVQVSKGVRTQLMFLQVAVVSILIFANISLFKNAMEVMNKPTGFEYQDTKYLILSISAPEFPMPHEIIPVMDELKSELLALPEVKDVSQSASPLSGFRILATTLAGESTRYTPQNKWVGDNYFSFIGQELIDGRTFSDVDIRDRNSVVVINEQFARELAPEGSAVGTKFDYGNNDIHTVIGVVKGVAIPGESDIPIRSYRPAPESFTSLMVKFNPGQDVSKEKVAEVLSEIDKLYAVFYFDPLESIVAKRLFAQTMTTVVTAFLACLLFVLAGVGLYGVLSYNLHMRRAEIGTRMAIGAKVSDILKMILKNTFSVAGFGMGFAVLVVIFAYLNVPGDIAEFLGGDMVLDLFITLLVISVLTFIACYLPLRAMVYKPVISNLQDNQ